MAPREGRTEQAGRHNSRQAAIRKAADSVVEESKVSVERRNPIRARLRQTDVAIPRVGWPREEAAARLSGAGFAAIAIAGVAFGVTSALADGRSSALRGAHGSIIEASGATPRTALVAIRPERFNAPVSLFARDKDSAYAVGEVQAASPRIFIVFDDMGLDRAAFDRVMKLPGPLTLSFLPYGRDVQTMVDEAREAGASVLLHLPMEPAGKVDPGPNSLSTSMSAERLAETLDTNLGAFTGYIGVNNHMGSRFTRNEKAMRLVLGELKDSGLFFLDSRTTGRSAAAQAGQAVGATVLRRDVFLDADGDRASILRQLKRLEEIARRDGSAIAIAHPRRSTLDVLGPWLTSAPSRGFTLATASDLLITDQDLGAPPLRSGS